MSPVKRLLHRRFLIIFSLMLCIVAFTPVSTAWSETHEADAVPWSGYWWPFYRAGLATGSGYLGHPAPLEKYDLLTYGFYPGRLTSWYLQEIYDPDTPTWWGHCGDWAQAACFENLQFFPSSEDNIIFRVGDKKGLMTLAHNNDIAVRADGTRPDVFHYWLLNYVKDEGKAFVADLDPDDEVWSYVIFKYDMNKTNSGNTLSVVVKVSYADDMVFPDYMGTQVRTANFTYTLFLDDTGEIVGGEWTGNSIGEHPDQLTFPLMARTTSPDLDYEEVLRLARSKDDFLEAGDTEEPLIPGTYNLILMDEDRYEISCSQGDTVVLDVEKLDGSQEEEVSAVLTDREGAMLARADIFEEDPMHIIVTAQDPPFHLSLTRQDYSRPSIYRIKIDIKKAFAREIPYIPKNGMWSGFALTNYGDSSIDGVMLTTYNAQGDPVQTVLGPVELQAGEKQLFFFDDLGWRIHEYQETERLVLLSDRPVSFLNLFGNNDTRMGCFVQGQKKGTHLVIPDVMAPMSMDGNMSGAVINESVQDIQLIMDVYTEDGVLFNEIDEVLGKGEKFSIVPGNYPFYSMPQGGWIDVETVEDAQISGYQSVSSVQRLDTLFALPVNAGQRIIPHVTPPERWITRVTLINPNHEENRIKFHPALAGEDHSQDLDILLGPWEKRKVEIQEWFGWNSQDPFFHSVIELNGERTFAGYYTYLESSGLGDEAGFPLLEEADFRSDLVLPHYSGENNTAWWTGVGIFNPSSEKETVTVEPYDREGELLEDLGIQLHLNPGAYHVMFVRSMGGARAKEISFVKFVVEEPGGLIGGFYLYGNRSDGMDLTDRLAGANM